MLLYNKSLRVIDLENNNLTKNGSDVSGVLAIADALRKNDTVLTLNLHNTNLDEKCGQALVEALEENETIIMIDLENNPNLNLH